jgi:hypothetical protein
MGREEEIRLIAYSIWEEEGCCHGHDMEHWLRAEVIWEETPKPKRVPRSTKTKSKKAAKQNKINKAASKKSSRI